ncbi:putative Vesicle transport protein SEC20 [Hypsibius exemplaris]|uniref:Vesicle transport protein SEC20 n=1 Tax=Hypsibius exemplaris TaxID=2072580 RepID=A0A1W0X2R5_HYPEX|nr:putative Vesicle transport protein SEC20 [Hypsibius exemplaris]
MDSSVRGVKECRTSLNLLDVKMNKVLEQIVVAGSRREIEGLLAEFRKTFTSVDDQLEALHVLGLRSSNPREKDTCATEVDERRKQFKSLSQEITVAAGQRLSIIAKEDRDELMSGGLNSAPGTRGLVKQQDIVKTSSQVTETLHRMSRNIARNVDQSGEAIKSLVSSSETLTKATDEFQSMSSIIQQGGRLIDKYDRRAFTDKVLITLAFAFFFLVCFYIVNKRLFNGFNWFAFFIEFFFPSQDEPLLIVKSTSSGQTNALRKEL